LRLLLIAKSAIVLYLNPEGKSESLENYFMAVSPGLREVLARRIAGEIILSSKPGSTMKKWRELFAVSQINLSEAMGLSSSVISDYESADEKALVQIHRKFVLSLCKSMKEKEAASSVNLLN
jgi:predicted transcriptional regulator